MTTTTSAMQLTAMPTVQVSTLIRRPPAEVFAAFVDPAPVVEPFDVFKGGDLDLLDGSP